MWIARTVQQARALRHSMAGTVALVPTMGALHDGHLSLIQHAQRLADHVLISLFVNPTQFGPDEDLAHYPRTEQTDLTACEQHHVAGVFCPTTDEIYPPGLTPCHVTVPALARTLEGEQRPGHFDGVCRVVAKLLLILHPTVACFGQKDLQQLRVIQAMAQDLFIPTRVVGCPTMREPDGLAMSSRNAYLTASQRRHATALYKALCEAKRLIAEAGETDPDAVQTAMHQVIQSHRVAVDYAVVRHPRTLASLDCIEPLLTGGVAALVAGRLGGVRLIDNMILAQPDPPDFQPSGHYL